MPIKLSLCLLKKCIHTLLFLPHKLLALLDSIGVAFDMNHSAMVQHPVENGRSDGDVDKDLVPLGEGLVVKTADAFSYRLAMS